MAELIAQELTAIPELPAKLGQWGLAEHPAFTNVARAVRAASSQSDRPFYSCEILGEE
jgi:hypothetical protein